MRCRICGTEAGHAFYATVLRRHQAEYLRCEKCGYLFAARPDWLHEAYKTPINVFDTGILSRNSRMAGKSAAVIAAFFKKTGKFMDFAGGYGLFVRLMRDRGFDFSWRDPYTENLFARGFEHDGKEKTELLTSFESFEHFSEPNKEIELMLGFSRNIIFSTTLLPDPVPGPSEWPYYGFEHGQHIGFYRLATLRYIAEREGLNLSTDGVSFHLFSEKIISPSLFRIISKAGSFGLARVLCLDLKSKTESDMAHLSVYPGERAG